MRVAVGTDHGGLSIKDAVIEALRAGGHEVLDLGAYEVDPHDDYPDYAELVGEAKDFLGGRSSAVQKKIEAQMAEAAEALDFERAAMLRDRLRAATFIQGSQAVNAEGVGNADVFAIAARGGQFGIQAFFIRGGQNWGHRAFFPSHTDGLDEAEVPHDPPCPCLCCYEVGAAVINLPPGASTATLE